MTNYCWISPVLTYASLGWEFLIPEFHAFTYRNVASSHREIALFLLVHTYMYLFASRCHESRGLGFSNKCIFIRALGRRRLESSSTDYENVHISHYTLIRVLPPMDWWVYVHENESRREAIRSIFSYEYMMQFLIRSLQKWRQSIPYNVYIMFVHNCFLHMTGLSNFCSCPRRAAAGGCERRQKRRHERQP